MRRKKQTDQLAKTIQRLASEVAALKPPDDPPAWGPALEGVRQLIGGPIEGVAAFAARGQGLRDFLGPLFRYPLPWSDDDRRRPAATALFFARLPSDIRPTAAGPAALEPFGWADIWIGRLATLQTRLPPGLDPRVLRRLARSFAARTPGGDDWDEVCVGCGLRRPLWPDYERHGRPCEHCGGTERLRPNEVSAAGVPWRKAAIDDLAAATPPQRFHGPGSKPGSHR
jgi:hypothetical protein